MGAIISLLRLGIAVHKSDLHLPLQFPVRHCIPHRPASASLQRHAHELSGLNVEERSTHFLGH
jgi:hypothetical protein